LSEATLTAEPVQPIAELINGSVSALWITTYSLDLALFNEFLLPRLGEPPLNVVVLGDQRRLTASLARVPVERVDSLAAVNSRWLLRGIEQGGHAFHPKTYLAIVRDRATLIVGSGNLTVGGLDEGREVFTMFRSGTAVGDAVIVAWRRWLRSIVEATRDVTLAERFQDLEERLPKPPPVALASDPALIDNLTRPIASQLVGIVADNEGLPADELLLAAPFFDVGAEAVRYLLTELKPRRVDIYITKSTSANGQHLAESLTASGAEVKVWAYSPDTFVHAKLVGIVSREQGWVLSGSPNLSQAALTLSSASGGNVELAVLARLEPDQVRGTFIPPGMTAEPRQLADIRSLEYKVDPEPAALPVRLITAVVMASGAVEVQTHPPCQPGWLLDDLARREELVTDNSGRTVTVAALEGRLVQIVSPDGAVLSNRVVIDDPAGLRSALTAGTPRADNDLPPELAAGDLDGPLARALIWLHRNLVMDVTERLVLASAGDSGEAAGAEPSDDELWERLEREQLVRDPRAGVYGRIWSRDSLGGPEPIILLIEALRARTPALAEVHRAGGSLLALLLDQGRAEEDGEKPMPHRWKLSTRIRVRARNVLSRWAAAQSDPRLLWVNPLAPAGNFVMVALTLAQLRLELARNPSRVELTADDIDELWLQWLRAFAGTGEGEGWLDQLESAALAVAYERIADRLPEIAAALCCVFLHPGPGYRARAVASQATLNAAFDRACWSRLRRRRATSVWSPDVR